MEGEDQDALEEATSRLFRGGKVGLAPMVRAGTLPLRMLALEYGADTVWTEEIIDRKLMECTRVTNDALGTVDFVTPKGNQVVLRTTARERPHVIVQLGTSTPELAVAAARVVAADVSGIDVNMGCPKRFSIQGGMGAALLDAPDKAASIIRALREALPLTPVSCKIRLLETPEQTLAFVRAMEAAGACAISVHMRTRDAKSQDPAQWEALAPVVQAVRVPVWANGDLYSRADMARIRELSGCEGVMLGRPALYNASVFKPQEPPLEPLDGVIRAYLRQCLRWDNHIHNCKYTVMEMMNKRRHPDHLKSSLSVRLPADKTIQAVSACKTLQALLEVWDLKDLWVQHQQQQQQRQQGETATGDGGRGATLEHIQRYDDNYFLRDEDGPVAQAGGAAGNDDETVVVVGELTNGAGGESVSRQGVKRKQEEEEGRPPDHAQVPMAATDPA